MVYLALKVIYVYIKNPLNFRSEISPEKYYAFLLKRIRHIISAVMKQIPCATVYELDFSFCIPLGHVILSQSLTVILKE